MIFFSKRMINNDAFLCGLFGLGICKRSVPLGFHRTKMFGDYPREILSVASHKV